MNNPIINPLTSRPLFAEASIAMRVMAGLQHYDCVYRDWPGSCKPFGPSVERRIADTLIRAGLAERHSFDSLRLTDAGKDLMWPERQVRLAHKAARDAQRQIEQKTREEADAARKADAERVQHMVETFPVLLEALQDAVSTMPADSLVKWVVWARAAIAKAEGR
jgi:hypothetical protein